MNPPPPRPLVVLWVAVMIATASGCQFFSPQEGEGNVLPLSPDATRATKHPHATVAPNGDVVVVWGLVSAVGEANIALLRLTGKGSLDPVRVNQKTDSAVVGRQVGPRVGVTTSGEVFVSWVDRAADVSGDIVVARSSDGGRTFGSPVKVNDDTSSAGQEYHDLVVLPDDTLAVVWLDERDAAPGYPNQKQVYFARSFDGGRSFEENRRLTDSPHGVCPCCRPSLATGPASENATLHVVYRDRLGEDLRVRVRSLRNGRTFGSVVDVPSPPWKYQACPIDGPGLAVTGDDLVVAWMDGATGAPTLWAARGSATSPPDRPLEKLGKLATTESNVQAHRPSIVVDSNAGAVAAWEDTEGRVWLRALGAPGDSENSAGAVANASTLLDQGTDGGRAHSVTLVLAPDGLHAFWCKDSGERVVSAALAGSEEGILGTSSLHHARLRFEKATPVEMLESGRIY